MLPEAVEKVYEKIKGKILNNIYQPGESLTEILLAQKYEIKRARLRQVIRRLETDGLVNRIPGKGAFVKSITPKDFQAIFELREALEGMAARLAARRRKDGELEKMMQLFDKNAAGSKEELLQHRKKAGQKLHDFILQSSENDLIEIGAIDFEDADFSNLAGQQHLHSGAGGEFIPGAPGNFKSPQRKGRKQSRSQNERTHRHRL